MAYFKISTDKKGKLKAVKLKSLKIRKSALEEFLQEVAV